MRRFLAFFACVLALVCTVHLATFAEEAETPIVEATAEVVESVPTTEENATEEEIEASTGVDFTTEDIVLYIEEHLEELGVIVSLIAFAFQTAKKFKWLNKAVSATNSNAIAVAENSEKMIADALAKMDKFGELFAKYEESEEEKQALKAMLDKAMEYIKNSKRANIEFANELADLLCLANIPNSKKEELYARHIAAVHAIEEAGVAEVTADENGNEA